MSLASSTHNLSGTPPQHQTMQDNTEEQTGAIADVTQPPSADTSRNHAHPHSQHNSPLLTSSNAAPSIPTGTLDYSGNPPPPKLEPQNLRAPIKVGSRWNTTNGKTLIEVRPEGEMLLMMLPICCFLGCCLSYSADMVFDDNTRECTITTWKGYLLCCRSPTKVIPYEEIANFALKRVGCPRRDRIPQYAIYLVTKGGDRYRISDAASMDDLEEKLLAYHAFLFGRGNPTAYRQPYAHELIVQ